MVIMDAFVISYLYKTVSLLTTRRYASVSLSMTANINGLTTRLTIRILHIQNITFIDNL